MNTVDIQVFQDTDHIRQIVAHTGSMYRSKFTPKQKAWLRRHASNIEQRPFCATEYSFDTVPAGAKLVSRRHAFGAVELLTYQITI